MIANLSLLRCIITVSLKKTVHILTLDPPNLNYNYNSLLRRVKTSTLFEVKH